MGWAKYYEDNISICNDRFFMAMTPEKICCELLKHDPVKKKKAEKNKPVARQQIACVVCPQTREPRQNKQSNNRQGLELRFREKSNPGFSKKLQLNGWWWSPSGECWCNSNTPSNRSYAQNIIISWSGELSISVL